jgi:hypothetical protein
VSDFDKPCIRCPNGNIEKFATILPGPYEINFIHDVIIEKYKCNACGYGYELFSKWRPAPGQEWRDRLAMDLKEVTYGQDKYNFMNRNFLGLPEKLDEPQEAYYPMCPKGAPNKRWSKNWDETFLPTPDQLVFTDVDDPTSDQLIFELLNNMEN